MPIYEVEALDPNGRAQLLSIVADDDAHLASGLREMGYEIVQVAPADSAEDAIELDTALEERRRRQALIEGARQRYLELQTRFLQGDDSSFDEFRTLCREVISQGHLFPNEIVRICQDTHELIVQAGSPDVLRRRLLIAAGREQELVRRAREGDPVAFAALQPPVITPGWWTITEDDERPGVLCLGPDKRLVFLEHDAEANPTHVHWLCEARDVARADTRGVEVHRYIVETVDGKCFSVRIDMKRLQKTHRRMMRLLKRHLEGES